MPVIDFTTIGNLIAFEDPTERAMQKSKLLVANQKQTNELVEKALLDNYHTVLAVGELCKEIKVGDQIKLKANFNFDILRNEGQKYIVIEEFFVAAKKVTNI